MSLNSNSLFHFTDDFEILKSILKNGFWINYSEENIPLVDDVQKLYIPMVCFCNIPLTKAAFHTEVYGKYGIGLNKSWAKKKKLNPVIYLSENSTLSETIISSNRESINNYSNHLKSKIITKKIDRSTIVNEYYYERHKTIKKGTVQKKKNDLSIKLAQDNITPYFNTFINNFKWRISIDSAFLGLHELASFNIMRFTKEYEGPFKYKTKEFSNYSFADEKEWRFVPQVTHDSPVCLFGKRYYDNFLEEVKQNSILRKTLSVDFEYIDIEYIIVSSNEERNQISQYLKEVFSNDILHIPILTLEQIKTDF